MPTVNAKVNIKPPLEPPQPTAECEHQFGFLKLGDARNCSGFRSCVNGVAFDFTCPEGLAFSSESYRCEWPDEVPDCDAEGLSPYYCLYRNFHFLSFFHFLNFPTRVLVLQLKSESQISALRFLFNFARSNLLGHDTNL